MSTKTKRRTYKCGKCQGSGHNARTCTVTAVATTVTVTPTVQVVTVEATPEATPEDTPSEDEPAPVQMAMGETQDLTHARRGPSGRPDTASPYTCPSCQAIAVLVLVEFTAGGTGLRCTECRNSTPIKTILKWGAVPTDKPKQ